MRWKKIDIFLEKIMSWVMFFFLFLFITLILAFVYSTFYWIIAVWKGFWTALDIKRNLDAQVLEKERMQKTYEEG
jgi:hypothetical protein